MFLRHLLASFAPGYAMSSDEVTFWQEQAALLDPLAYEFVKGSGATRTVGAGETWFLLNAWNVDAAGSGVRRFHRNLDVGSAVPLSEGTTITTAANATYFFYVCKPSLVTGADSRYTTDPRGLYFERIRRMGELTQYHLGVTATGSSGVNATFPTDFDYGLILEVSVMDLAWLILLYSDETTGMNTVAEISDADPVRFAERCVVPFNPDTFPKIRGQGVSLSTGAGNLVYLKLPADW